MEKDSCSVRRPWEGTVREHGHPHFFNLSQTSLPKVNKAIGSIAYSDYLLAVAASVSDRYIYS